MGIATISPGGAVAAYGLGLSDAAAGRQVTTGTWFQAASLSKTVATAFALDFLAEHGHGPETRVNRLLSDAAAPWRLEPAEGAPQEWADQIEVRHLVDHSGLGMHYVPGVPLSRPMPPVEELVEGRHPDLGYHGVRADRPPGQRFQYSGGGFLVLEHLMLTLHPARAKTAEEMCRPFLDSLGLQEFTFEQRPAAGADFAVGHADGGSRANGDEACLMFPAFAAGGLCTPAALARFLARLTAAFRDPHAKGPVTHDTAVRMLGGADWRLRNTSLFMGGWSATGLGVFVMEAGPNMVAVHQAANDGYRGVYAVCFQGPDAGQGVVLLSNGSLQGVIANALAGREYFREARWQGVDLAAFEGATDFATDGVPQEQVVNMGYRDLLFSAFKQDRADVLPADRAAVNPLADYDLLQGAEVESYTDARFAPCSNLILPTEPQFDPAHFGRHGKTMDSWESQRHNPLPQGCDEAVLRLRTPGKVAFAEVSTAFHDGNHAQGIAVVGITPAGEEVTLVPRSQLSGHSVHRFRVAPAAEGAELARVRVQAYPDGGVSRLRLYGELPQEALGRFPAAPGGPAVERVAEEIPSVAKAVPPPYRAPSPAEAAAAWEQLQAGGEVNVACASLGAAVEMASNEHYGPASAILSPVPPKGMFDGFETVRSRYGDFSPPAEVLAKCSQHVIVRLAKAAQLRRCEIDMTFFVNNNPRRLEIEGRDAKGDWHTLLPSVSVKEYRGNIAVFQLPEGAPAVGAVRIWSRPCGGYNRAKFFAEATPELLRAPLQQ